MVKKSRKKLVRSKMSKVRATGLSWFLILSGLANITFVMEAFVTVLRFGVASGMPVGLENGFRQGVGGISFQTLPKAYVGVGGLVGVFLFQAVYGWYLRLLGERNRLGQHYVQFGWLLAFVGGAYLMRFVVGWILFKGWV